MKLERLFIFFIILLFVGAILIINRFTSITERKTKVYIQGAFYIDRNDIYKIVNDDIIEKMLRDIDPDILIVQEPVTFSDNLFEEFESEISPSEKDSIINIYFKKIEDINSKLGFDIILLNVWDLESIQARKNFYRKNRDDPNFKQKVDLYNKLNQIITTKIEELNLKKDIFTVNSSLFDNLKEVEGNYFSSVFGEELGLGDYKYMNKKYTDKILEIINEDKKRKTLIIYDSNQKYELIKRLTSIPDINVIRVMSGEKNKD